MSLEKPKNSHGRDAYRRTDAVVGPSFAPKGVYART